MPSTLTTQYSTGRTLDDAVQAFHAVLARREELLALDGPKQPRPGKTWTSQEELGHLCDSALNNIQRFVRLQVPAHMQNSEWHAQGYAQDDWVRVMDYAAMDWSETVDLWNLLNRRVLHLMQTARPECLDNIWVYGEKRLTLEWLLIDYVGHQEHHLRSIFA